MDEKRYESVDIEGLAQALAKKTWEDDTHSVPEDVLYNLSTIKDSHTGQVEIVKEIASEWASKYWLLVDVYKLLILEFSKTKQDDDKSSSSQTRSEGTG